MGLVGKLRPRYRSKTQELSFVCHFFQGLLVFLICLRLLRKLGPTVKLEEIKVMLRCWFTGNSPLMGKAKPV